MHIPDGFLPPSISITGYAVTGGITWYSLRQINQAKNSSEQIPKASLLTAAFFVVSLIHIPVPPASVHLLLNGLLGSVLGAYAFPAILIGLFFQAVLFQHGGLSTLGINTLIQGIPALIAAYIFSFRHQWGNKPLWHKICAFFAGFLGTGLAALIFTLIVVVTIPADIDAPIEQMALYASLIAHGILALLEGVFVVMVISFLERVKPELLESK